MTDTASSETKNRVFNVISDMFDMDIKDLNESSSPDTIERWDSMGHIQLIGALEQEFGIVFSPEEQIEMLDVDLVIETIMSRLSSS